MKYSHLDLNTLTANIKLLAKELGFSEIKVTDLNLDNHKENLKKWLELDYHGNMKYMEEHFDKRVNPKLLVPEVERILIAKMDYMPPNTNIIPILANPKKGAISRYALGKDYHKLIRKRLKKLCDKISYQIGEFIFRPFADSAPVSEKPLGEKSGLGWIGKNTLLINKSAGSYFFLGAIYTDLPLPIDNKASNHCGSCNACIRKCPTNAIVAPYQIDSRKCISYLTIENKGTIPIDLRKKMGNRIFGCDDCQLVCPFNKFTKSTKEDSFLPRHNLADPDLIELFKWSESKFLLKTQGSPIKRTGYNGWLRNIAIALGNAPYSKDIIKVLESKLNIDDEIVKEHITWALTEQNIKRLK